MCVQARRLNASNLHLGMSHYAPDGGAINMHGAGPGANAANTVKHACSNCLQICPTVLKSETVLTTYTLELKCIFTMILRSALLDSHGVISSHGLHETVAKVA